MRNLLLIMFLSLFVFACTEEAEEMMDGAGEMMEEAADATKEMASDAAEGAKAMMDGPKLEPLPDWDSLPPIEEMAAEEGSTMMEKAEEKTEEVVEMAKDKAEEMMKQE